MLFLLLYCILTLIIFFANKEKGAYGSFTKVDEFNLTLIPMDYDLLSMEMTDSFKVSCFGKPFYSFFFADIFVVVISP